MISFMGKKKEQNDNWGYNAVQVNLRLPPKIAEQLDKYVASIESRRNTEILIAVRALLESKGFWPPPAAQPETK